MNKIKQNSIKPASTNKNDENINYKLRFRNKKCNLYCELKFRGLYKGIDGNIFNTNSTKLLKYYTRKNYKYRADIQ